MSNGRKLGFSGLTSLSLDSLEAGVGSMTDSVHLAFYSYFFRTFRTLVLRGYCQVGRESCYLSPKEHFCVASINVFEIFGEGSGQLKPVWASIAIQGAELAGVPLWRSCRSACTSMGTVLGFN